MTVADTLSRAEQIQKIADCLYGQTHDRTTIPLEDVASLAQIDSDDAASLLRKLEAKELVDFNGHNVRLMGAGKALYEEQSFPEFVLGFDYCLLKYRAAVVRIVVVNTKGDDGAGTGSSLAAPPIESLRMPTSYRNARSSVSRVRAEM